MAYGTSWRSKGQEYDPRNLAPRDAVEEAARAAGMSVEEWLEYAAESSLGHDMSSRHRRRTRGAGRGDESPLSSLTSRIERRSNRDHSEDRVARIISDAMNNFEGSLRKNEERTAAALSAMMQNAHQSAASDTTQVHNLIRNLETSMSGGQSVHDERPALPDYSSLRRQSESRIENVLGAKAQLPQSTSDSVVSKAFVDRPQRDLRSTAAINAALAKVNHALRGLEQSPQQNEILKTLRSLDQRLTGIEQSPYNNPEMIGQMVGEMAALNQHVTTQRPHVDFSDVNRQMNALGQRIDALDQSIRSQPSQTGPNASQFSSHFDRLTGEVSELRASIRAKSNTGPDAGIETLRRQMATMGDRLDGLTQKIAALRMSGSDIPQPRAIDGELDELKRLILISQAPVTDERVLNAIQSLEHKIAMVERAPYELSARLDRIQSMIGERPVASIPPQLESLLQKLASRVKDFDNSAQDEAAFASLHQEIQLISRKIEQTPQALSNAAVTDVSGLERAVSAMLLQFDGLKADMGSLAEHAAKRATQEALSHIVMPAAAPAADISGIEHSIQGLFRQMDAWKADMGHVAEDAARRVANETIQRANAYSTVAGGHDTAELQRALGDMQVSQKDAERRTTQTLEAVHDTLKRVVDRLVEMEKDIEHKSLAPAVAAAVSAPAYTAAPVPQQAAFVPPPFHHAMPEPVLSPMAVDPMRKPLNIQAEGPAIQPHIYNSAPHQPSAPAVSNPLPVDGAPAWNAGAPVAEGAAATIAAMRAQRLGLSSPAVTTTAPPANKNALGAALAAARDAVSGIKLPVGKKAIQPPLHEPGYQSMPASLGGDNDMPLEPGSGRPQKGLASVDNDPKAKFLAAARQAAQTAAGQASEALEAAKEGAAATKTKSSGLKTKHALLLGLAALIVAAMATTVVTGLPKMLGGGSKPKETVGTIDHLRKQIQISHQARKAPETTMAEANRLPPRQILAEIQEPPAPDGNSRPVRSVDVARLEPKAAPATPAQSDVSESRTMPAADPIIVGSLGSNGPVIESHIRPQGQVSKVTISPNDPLFKFEGLKDAPALKAAARKGDVAAYAEIGNRFADGRGAPRDPKTAALWLERAAEQGSAPARYRLGTLYREGKGVDRNARMALAHFMGAAELGNARAMHNTAVLLAEGVNGSPDYAQATDWFKRAAEYGIRDSQFNLAILYARGLGVSQDLVASYSWFAAAAGQGDEDAVKKRDEVASRLSPDQLRMAKEVTAIWKAKIPDINANEVPVPPGGWDASANSSVTSPAKTSANPAGSPQKRG